MRVTAAQLRGKNQPDPPELSDQQRWALYARWLDAADAAVRANAIICLIHQANYLLDRQIAALESAFITEGGYSEQLATERLRQRRNNQADRPERPQPPACPKCGTLMALRTAKAGKTPAFKGWLNSVIVRCVRHAVVS